MYNLLYDCPSSQENESN